MTRDEERTYQQLEDAATVIRAAWAELSVVQRDRRVRKWRAGYAQLMHQVIARPAFADPGNPDCSAMGALMRWCPEAPYERAERWADETQGEMDSPGKQER